MVRYTDADIESYKAALARYAAKEKCLVDKWTKRLDDLECAIRAVPADYPSSLVHAELDRLSKLQNIFAEFLADVKTPCDCFITDFEWSRVK